MWRSPESECCGCRRAGGALGARRADDDDEDDLRNVPDVWHSLWMWGSARRQGSRRSLREGLRQDFRASSARGSRGGRGQCRIAAALSLTLLLACSLASRPAQAAQALAQAHRWGPGGGGGQHGASRVAPWAPGLPRHAARHARHAAARLQPRQASAKPWNNPCGSAVAVAPAAARQPRPQRPSGPKDFDWPPPSMEGGALERKGWSLRTVRRRIRMARAHLRHRRRHIHQVYGQVKVLRNKYSFDWLPQEQIPWYRSEITCLDRDSQATHVLPALRSALQNFSATFVELQKARRWTIDRPGLSNRTLLINELASHVKGMLCEVETAMQERALPLPPASLPPEGLAEVEPSRWDPDPDLTGALIQDWGVVSAYTDALYGWALILRELGHAHKKKGPAVGHAPGGVPPQPEPRRMYGVHARNRNQFPANSVGILVVAAAAGPEWAGRRRTPGGGGVAGGRSGRGANGGGDTGGSCRRWPSGTAGDRGGRAWRPGRPGRAGRAGRRAPDGYGLRKTVPL